MHLDSIGTQIPVNVWRGARESFGDPGSMTVNWLLVN